MEAGRLAKRIRAFRKLKGLTQAQLAERMGISLGIIGAIERGNRMPDEQLLKQIADTLHIDIEELLNQK